MATGSLYSPTRSELMADWLVFGGIVAALWFALFLISARRLAVFAVFEVDSLSFIPAAKPVVALEEVPASRRGSPGAATHGRR